MTAHFCSPNVDKRKSFRQPLAGRDLRAVSMTTCNGQGSSRSATACPTPANKARKKLLMYGRKRPARPTERFAWNGACTGDLSLHSTRIAEVQPRRSPFVCEPQSTL